MATIDRETLEQAKAIMARLHGQIDAVLMRSTNALRPIWVEFDEAITKLALPAVPQDGQVTLDRHGLFLLLDECRDAIQPLTQAQVRLHNISQTLASRIDSVIKAENTRRAASPQARTQQPTWADPLGAICCSKNATHMCILPKGHEGPHGFDDPPASGPAEP